MSAAVDLAELGFRVEGRASGGQSGGAWFATSAEGERVVLKWVSGEGMAERYAALLPALDRLRARGVPVPEYRLVHGGTVSVQQRLPGRSFDVWPRRLVDRVIECVGAQVGLPVSGPAWGELVVQALAAGADSLRTHSERARRISELAQSLGAEPSWFSTRRSLGANS